MSDFENNSMSRRDAIRLAQFGALLATGLIITQNAEGAEPQAGTLKRETANMFKPTADSVIVKLYSVDGASTLKLRETVSLEPDLLQQQGLTTPTAFTIKLTNAANKSFAHTIKLTGGEAATFKLNMSTPNESS